ncbi:MAG: hypothetical protein PVJ02_12335 [Gemmatimonadota bacterium]|jgi:hypothetical protein
MTSYVTRSLLTGTTLLALASCGGGDAPSGAREAAQATDTAIKPMVREPLTEADMAGLSMANLSVELPWTTNRISRDPAPAAPRAALRSVDVSEEDGFDRAVFTFGADTPFPGYGIQIADSTATFTCGGEEQHLDQDDGARALLVHFTPARASDAGDVWVPVRLRSVAQARFQRAGVICDDGQEVVWMATLADGDGTDTRILEMRAPNRLVVDLR